MDKMLLLDVDGVILRDPLLLEHVKHNCTQYVRSKFPEAKDPSKLNRLLYKRYGHTAYGIQRAFRISTTDFNEKVYDKSLMEHLWAHLSSTEFQKEAAEIHSLSKSGWEIRLFSNAPLKWTIPVASAISSDVSIVCNDFFMKPDPRAYSLLPIHGRKVFVDDSELNLTTCRYMKNWTCLQFDEKAADGSEFLTIGSFWELGLYLNSIDQAIGGN